MRANEVDEEKWLREAALQNAQAILLARQRAEQELAAERERLRITLASIGDAIICTDADGRVTFLNGIAEALTGWLQSEAAGRPLPDVFRVLNEHTRVPIENPALLALREGMVVGLSNQMVLVARDGVERPIDDSAAPIRDASGVPAGAVLVFRDVSEQRRAEETRARLAAIVESSDDAIISKTLDGVVRSWNAGAERLFGYAAEEAVGRPITFIIPSERIYEERVILERLRRGERVEHFDTVRVSKDGRRIDISLTVSPIRNSEGHLIGASKVARDITGQKRAAEALARSEQELADFFENASVGLHWVGPDGTILRVNQTELALLGYDREGYVGRHIAEFHADRDVIVDILRRLTAGETLRDCEARMICKDGSIRDVLIDSSVLWEEGRFVHTRCFTRDVTDRKRAERRLAAQNDVTRALAESATLAEAALQFLQSVCEHQRWEFGAFWSVDEGDQVLRCSMVWHSPSVQVPRFEAMTRGTTFRQGVGLPGRVWACEQAVWVPDVVEDGNFPRAPVAAAEGLHAALGCPIVLSGEVLGVAEFFSREVRAPDEELVGMMAGLGSQVGQFIERKRAEEALAQSLSRLDYTVRLSGVGFWFCDLPFDVLVWDERVKDHFWLPPDAIVTINTFYERLHPDDREPTRRAIEATIRDRVAYDVDYRTVDPTTGAIKWVRAMGGTTYAVDGTPTRFVGVTVDATVRKLDQERLARAFDQEREHARLLKQVADAALTIHSSASLESVLRVVAEEARRIVGAHQAVTSLSAGNDRAQPINTVSLSDKYALSRGYDASPRVRGIYAVACEINRSVRLTHDDLQAHPAWRNVSGGADNQPPLRGCLAAPFVSRSGGNLGLVYLSDKFDGEFTETDEAVLVQLAHIASVAIENSRLYDEMRQQDRRKDEFLATLAHELRNPLAPVRNGLQILRAGKPQGDDLDRTLGMMERQLGHLVHLVDDLMDVSRVSQGKVALRKERVELQAVVDAAVETARQAVEAAGHELALRIPAESLEFDADRTRLAQVLANLLNNAAKYTPRGGRIVLSALRVGPNAEVRVTDNGIGIPADMLPKIFDMFTQVGSSLDRAEGGLGIGLTLVRRLVELHGGSVTADSPGPDQGSTFTIRVPLAAGSDVAAEAPGHGAVQPETVTKRVVLVVDDNRDAADSLAMLLGILGHDVRTAYDGPAALGALETFSPHLVLLDIGLPGLNGYEVARRIRERPDLNGVRLVALTGWGQEEDRRRTREAGFDHHLVKPADLETVIRLLGEGVAS